MGKVLVIGSLNMDLVINVDHMPKKGETLIGQSLQQMCGGKGANQAVAIARLGGEVSMIGRVGDDGFGTKLLKNLKENRVDTKGIKICQDTPSGMAVINVDEKGDNSIIVIPGANFEMNKEVIKENVSLVKACDIMVMQLEIPIDTVEYGLKCAKELGKFTILNPAPAKSLNKNIIKHVDVLIPNETELEILSDMRIVTQNDLYKACKVMLNKGVKCLIVTLGEKGCVYMDNDTRKTFNAKKVNAIDTTGAGDSFIGGLSTWLAASKTIEEAVSFAIKVGALTVTKKGAQSSLPTLDEVLCKEEERL